MVSVQTCPGLLSHHSSSDDQQSCGSILDTDLINTALSVCAGSTQMFLFAEISDPYRNESGETFKVFCSVTGQGITNINTGSRNSKVQTTEKKK